MRRLIPLAVKAAVSGLLLYFALDLVKFSTLTERLSAIETRWIAAMLLAVAVQVFLVSLRWYQIALQCGSVVGRANVLRYTLVGTFFNQTLPSTVGGDAARMWLLAREGAGWKAAVTSVLIDRAAGLFMLAVLVLIGLPWSLDLIQNPIGRAALMMIGFGSIAALFATFAFVHVFRPFLDRFSITRYVADAVAVAWKVLVSPRAGGAVAVLSILIHMLSIIAAYSAARAIDSPFGLAHALLLIPPVILIASIPVSIAGWGVREGAMVVAFAQVGLPESDGLLVSMIFGAAQFALGAVGGIVWIASSTLRKRRNGAPELIRDRAVSDGTNA